MTGCQCGPEAVTAPGHAAITNQPAAIITPLHPLPAFVILLENPKGRHYRRVYLNLTAAEKSYRRAVEAGQVARLVLCTVTAVREVSQWD